MAMKKLLITGTSGFVGSRIANHLAGKFDIIAPAHRELEITSAKGCMDFIGNTKPDVLLHLAAISDTGYCENHPDESMLVNVTGVENLAIAAQAHNAKMVFFSSDQVYNGCTKLGLLSEDTPLAPENHYGRHKLLAEQRALEISGNCVALRATWMYDNPRPGMRNHNNFIINFQKAISEGSQLRFATREFRGITWVEEIAQNIIHTFNLPGGVYNFGAENTLNTYSTACGYARILGHNPEGFILPDNERFPAHIRNISISLEKIRHASDGKIKFKDTICGLAAFCNKTDK